jgi:hypothetical protein
VACIHISVFFSPLKRAKRTYSPCIFLPSSASPFSCHILNSDL